MAPSYRSLVGGFYSSDPNDLTQKRTIRCNNPWALNVSSWQQTFPGFIGVTAPDASVNANKSSIYETPEQGVAAGWTLLRKYRDGGHDTVGKIINRYGGNQDYSEYLKFVTDRTFLTEDTIIDLDTDVNLLKLAKAMFRYEAGVDTPWSDQQILYGFKLGREYAGGTKAPAPAPIPQVPKATTTRTETGGWWAILLALLSAFGLGPKQVVTQRDVLKRGDISIKGGDVWKLQERLREIGFVDLVVDGEFGGVTEQAIRTFQDRENLDPDGEVGELTLDALNRSGAHIALPPLMPPPVVVGGTAHIKPAWYIEADKDIGWKERGDNQGIEYFIKDTNPPNGQVGDPYCAIGINAWLGRAGVKGSGSAMARSFETNPNFVRLMEPALGAIITMWRTSPSSGSGHVFTYDGESEKGMRGIGANEDDMVKRSFHDRARITGYWWPKSVSLPTGGKIQVSDTGTVVNRTET